jgi:uncharacterized membrane protein YoaK (UPF0700 family)
MLGEESHLPLRLDEVWRGLVNDERHGPLPGILVLLTGVAGVVDALSILRIDDVFVANITGNIIFIGLALVGARGYSIVAPLIALACFLAGGVAAGACVPRPLTHRGRAAYAAAVVQLVDLAIATGLFAVSSHPGMVMRYALLAVLALGMGAKSAFVRFVGVPGLTTSVFTSTLTGLAAGVARGGLRDPGFAVRIMATLALLVGAVISAVLALKTYPWCSLAFATFILVPTVWWSHTAARSNAPWATPRS